MELDYSRIKQSTLEGLNDYIFRHYPAGGFLTAVLENNLVEAFKAADDENCHALFHIVGWVYNEALFGCWGSPEKVAAWLTPKKEDSNAG